MNTVPAARNEAAPLQVTSDSPGNAPVLDVASPEQISKQGMVRLAAIIAEWREARDTLLRGGWRAVRQRPPKQRLFFRSPTAASVCRTRWRCLTTERKNTPMKSSNDNTSYSAFL